MKPHMIWENTLEEYQFYLKLERGMSENSVTSYSWDIKKLISFLNKHQISETPQNISAETLRLFVYESARQLNARSQARLVSSLKNFFRYLIVSQIREDFPMELIDSPKVGLKLPDVLSVEEIDKVLSAIDLSTVEGHRNKAIIETLYGCGLRVSELVSLRLSDLFFDENFIRVTGKGNKQRLIPLGNYTQKQIQLYTLNHRQHVRPTKGHEDFVFLNRRGKQLTRAMIFTLIRQTAQKAGITKKISPHTFRHSFATHLLENGAQLNAIQAMLGHESITTTEIYVHIDRVFLRNVIDKYHPQSLNSQL